MIEDERTIPATRVVHLRSDAWRRAAECDRVRIDRLTKWGNPYRIARGADDATERVRAIAKFRAFLRMRPQLVADARAELRGRTLGCWCSPLPCHGDVLAAVAEGSAP